MKVVANAGPLVALGKLGLVHLLHQLYGAVLIPSAVHQEVVIRGLELEQPDAYDIQLAIARQEHQESDLVFQAILTRDDIWISETLVRRVWGELRKGGA